MLMPGVGEQEARERAEAMRRAVEALHLERTDEACGAFLTVCIGAASGVPRRSTRAADLFAAARKALFLAKQAGENRTDFEAV